MHVRSAGYRPVEHWFEVKPCTGTDLLLEVPEATPPPMGGNWLCFRLAGEMLLSVSLWGALVLV